MLGVAWAVAAVGAAYGFMTGNQFSLYYATIFSFLGILPGLFLVVILEFFYMKLDSFVEMRKQTDILNDILQGIKQ